MSLDLQILLTASKIKEHFEMHDKIIIATALFNEARLISKDSENVNSRIIEVIW